MGAKDPELRTALARAAGHARTADLSTAEREEMAAAARAAQLAKWAADIDPDGTMDPDELAARLTARRRLLLARMTAASVASKARKRAEREAHELDEILAAGGVE